MSVSLLDIGKHLSEIMLRAYVEKKFMLNKSLLVALCAPAVLFDPTPNLAEAQSEPVDELTAIDDDSPSKQSVHVVKFNAPNGRVIEVRFSSEYKPLSFRTDDSELLHRAKEALEDIEAPREIQRYLIKDTPGGFHYLELWPSKRFARAHNWTCSARDETPPHGEVVFASKFKLHGMNFQRVVGYHNTKDSVIGYRKGVSSVDSTRCALTIPEVDSVLYFNAIDTLGHDTCSEVEQKEHLSVSIR